jgi:hypothetical protein
MVSRKALAAGFFSGGTLKRELHRRLAPCTLKRNSPAASACTLKRYSSNERISNETSSIGFYCTVQSDDVSRRIVFS